MSFARRNSCSLSRDTAYRHACSHQEALMSVDSGARRFRPGWAAGFMIHAAAIVAALVLTGPVRAATLDEIKKRGYMIVATEDDFRPFEFVQDGKPTGFDNEMLALLRKAVPFEIRQEIIPWTGLLAGVSTGKYDVAVTAAIITKERSQSLDFTMPIADATHYFVKRKGDTSITEIKDLSGKSVGVQAGSALLARLPELETMLAKTGGKLGKVVEYTSYPEAYQDLALKRTDYVVNTVINLQALVKEKPGVFELGLPVTGKSFPAWAVKKGNAELLALLNGFLAEQRKNGTQSQLQVKWFGQSFDDMPEVFTPEF
jgi:polar amino acid transport system substrate-binding protein